MSGLSSFFRVREGSCPLAWCMAGTFFASMPQRPFLHVSSSVASSGWWEPVRLLKWIFSAAVNGAIRIDGCYVPYASQSCPSRTPFAPSRLALARVGSRCGLLAQGGTVPRFLVSLRGIFR